MCKLSYYCSLAYDGWMDKIKTNRTSKRQIGCPWTGSHVHDLHVIAFRPHKVQVPQARLLGTLAVGYKVVCGTTLVEAAGPKARKSLKQEQLARSEGNLEIRHAVMPN